VIAYVDSSVILRVVLSQPGALVEWADLEAGATSSLAEVECLRTLDRLCVQTGVGSEEMALRREAAYMVLDSLTRVELDRPVLSRAAQPLPVPLGTLDAIHLASALAWSEESSQTPVFATHDRALGLAARAFGFQVVGVPA
jgi:predicted nucleic acid-binding protein